MRKIFFILILVCAAPWPLSAYGKNAEPSAPETTPDTTANPANDTNLSKDIAEATTLLSDEEAEGAASTPLSSKATTIKAQDIPVDDEAFKEVLTTAYTSSPALGVAEYQTKAANEDIMSAKAGWGPDLSVGTGYDFEFDHNVYGQGMTSTGKVGNQYRQYTHQGNASARAELKQNIYAGGATEASIAASKSRALGAQAGYARGQQNTIFKAAQAHLNVAKNKAIQELHAGNVKVLQKRLEVAKARFEFGDLTRADVASTEAKLEKAKSELTNARAEFENAKAIYRKDIGKDPNEILSVPSVPKFLPTSREEAMQLTLQNNPILKQLDAKVDEAKASLEGSYAGLKPKIDLTATAKRNLNYAWNENSGRNYGRDRKNVFAAGAQATLQLDVMGSNQSRIRKAKYESALQRISSIYQRQDIIANTVKAWETYKALESRITELESQVKAAKVALDTYTEGYLVGNNTTLEVLTAEQEYFTAQIELTRVKLDFLNSAFALGEATGVLTPQNLGLNVRTFDAKEHYDSMSRWGLDVKHDQTEYSGEPLLELP